MRSHAPNGPESRGRRSAVNPVREIPFVEEIVRERRGMFRSMTPPGHLLHLVCGGRVEQFVDDRRQVLEPGTLVWYADSENCSGRILAAPWRFVTLNFLAPELPPPRIDARVMSASPAVRRAVRTLLKAFRKSGGIERALDCHRRLLALLQMVGLPDGAVWEGAGDRSPDQWWRVERYVRGHLEQHVRIEALARSQGMSQRTLTRLCRSATGLAPARRIHFIRLARARHLLQFSARSVSEIAATTGFGRVQELSRAMRRSTGQSPREVRKATPDFRSWKTTPASTAHCFGSPERQAVRTDGSN